MSERTGSCPCASGTHCRGVSERPRGRGPPSRVIRRPSAASGERTRRSARRAADFLATRLADGSRVQRSVGAPGFYRAPGRHWSCLQPSGFDERRRARRRWRSRAQHQRHRPKGQRRFVQWHSDGLRCRYRDGPARHGAGRERYPTSPALVPIELGYGYFAAHRQAASVAARATAAAGTAGAAAGLSARTEATGAGAKRRAVAAGQCQESTAATATTHQLQIAPGEPDQSATAAQEPCLQSAEWQRDSSPTSDARQRSRRQRG